MYQKNVQKYFHPKYVAYFKRYFYVYSHFLKKLSKDDKNAFYQNNYKIIIFKFLQFCDFEKSRQQFSEEIVQNQIPKKENNLSKKFINFLIKLNSHNEHLLNLSDQIVKRYKLNEPINSNLIDTKFEEDKMVEELGQEIQIDAFEQNDTQESLIQKQKANQKLFLMNQKSNQCQKIKKQHTQQTILGEPISDIYYLEDKQKNYCIFKGKKLFGGSKKVEKLIEQKKVKPCWSNQLPTDVGIQVMSQNLIKFQNPTLFKDSTQAKSNFTYKKINYDNLRESQISRIKLQQFNIFQKFNFDICSSDESEQQNQDELLQIEKILSISTVKEMTGIKNRRTLQIQNFMKKLKQKQKWKKNVLEKSYQKYIMREKSLKSIRRDVKRHQFVKRQ